MTLFYWFSNYEAMSFIDVCDFLFANLSIVAQGSLKGAKSGDASGSEAAFAWSRGIQREAVHDSRLRRVGDQVHV